LHSAWDFYLGGLYLLVLSQSPETEPIFCRFCTHEAELASFLSTWMLRVLKVTQESAPIPYFEFDENLYVDPIGSGSEKVLALAAGRVERFRQGRRTGVIRSIEEARIPDLLAQVTEEFHVAIGPKKR
jgi:hypothetical protein